MSETSGETPRGSNLGIKGTEQAVSESRISSFNLQPVTGGKRQVRSNGVWWRSGAHHSMTKHAGTDNKNLSRVTRTLRAKSEGFSKLGRRSGEIGPRLCSHPLGKQGSVACAGSYFRPGS